MQQRHFTEFYVELLQLTWLPTKRSQILSDMLSEMFFLGLAGALFGILVSLLLNIFAFVWVGALLGTLLGALFGKVSNGSLKIRPADRIKWTWRNAKLWLLVIGPVIGLVVGLAGALIFKLPTGLVGGLVFALVITLVTGLVGGLSGKQINEDQRVKPNQGIRNSGWNALRVGLLAALVGAPGIGLVAGPIGGLVGGLAFGLLGSLVFGGSAYLQHYLLRFLLWQNGAIPLHYVLFLEKAHDHILLQRVGGGYRFIHPLFQEYFASLTNPPTTP